MPHEQRFHPSVDNPNLLVRLALTEATPIYFVDDTELASSAPALSRGNIISHFIINQTTIIVGLIPQQRQCFYDLGLNSLH